MNSFKPSQVVLDHPPLVGTMRHARAEHAAALLVRACARHGDDWQDVPPEMVGDTITADLDEQVEPLFGLCDNPFFTPDFHALIEGGYAEWTGKERGPIRFTEQGVEAMRTWVSGAVETLQ